MTADLERFSTTRSKQIASVFHRYAGKEFIFVEPGGNFGDRLIFKGAEKIARQLGISFTAVNYEEFNPKNCNPEQVIYIHGSGGYNPWWSGRPVKAFRKAVMEHKGVTILGPTTFDTDRVFLDKNLTGFLHKDRNQRVIVAAREWVSFQALKAMLPDWVEIIHDHDTSLNLDKSDIYTVNPESQYTFYAIRDDIERIPLDHRAFFNVWLDPVRHAKDLDSWIYIHARANRIITNRLHSAILGSILGNETTLLPNNYHKNRAVWEYSLQDSGVSWSDDLPGYESDILLDNNRLLKKILGNRWVQRVVRKFHGFKPTRQ